MTLQEFQSKVKAFDSNQEAYTFTRRVDPGLAAHRKNGCGKVEVWVRTMNRSQDGRWGGGPTLDAALSKAMETLDWYKENA